MKISIKNDKKKFTFWLPIGVLGIALNFAKNKKQAEFKDKLNLDKSTIKAILKSLSKAKKYHPHLVLIEVHSKDNQDVKITL